MALTDGGGSGGGDGATGGGDPGGTGAAAAAAVLRPRVAAAREWLRAGFFWALGVALLACLALAAWRLSRATLAVISPFVVAVVLALLLDPVADRLERRGLSRGGAVGAVFGAFVLLLGGIGALLVPALVGQASRLAENGPQYVQNLRAFVDEWLAGHRRIGTFTLPENFNALFAQFSERASVLVRQSAGGATAFLVGSITTALQTVVALIVTFYLLLDIDRLRARLFYLLPERARGPAGQLASDIGGVFSDYLRGLLIVCALYGLTATLLLYGLGFVHGEMRGYALLVGAFAGLLYAVPYVGALATAVVTFLVAFAAGGVGFGGITVGLVLLLNQVFDNVVTPRVVGGGVGLHPVAAVFALVLGGELFGLWGLLLSVPIAASVQVVLFRLFPKLTTPTPRPFLRAQGIRPGDDESAKILEGDEAGSEGPAAAAPPPAAAGPAA
jgi:predicted PurR-regulated permease PerM